MKTILLTVFQGAVAKNVLRTDVIKELLADPNVRVICLMRFPERVLSYQKEIFHERLVYDSFYRTPTGALERLLSFLKFRLIRTATTDLRHTMSYDARGSRGRYVASTFFNRVLATPVVRSFLRFFDYHYIGDPGFGSILEKYLPDVVFLTHLFDDAEVSLLRESKKRSIPVVGFINSWDKLTARCSLRLLPDTLVVFNDIVKHEAMAHADMPESKIFVCGLPQYDQYVTGSPSSREAFFKKIGCDPSKHLILYSPAGIRFSGNDWAMIDFLHDVVSDMRLKNEVELLVRFPPNDFVDNQEFSKRPWLRYTLPGTRLGTKWSTDWDMDFEELQFLADTLRHSSLLVCYSTSMAIDAAIFGKPVIGINFEIKKELPLVAHPTEYYKTDHYKKVIRTGGVRLVENREELIEWVGRYIKNPSIDHEARERLVSEQCWRLDGKSGERIAAVVLGALS